MRMFCLSMSHMCVLKSALDKCWMDNYFMVFTKYFLNKQFYSQTAEVKCFFSPCISWNVSFIQALSQCKTQMLNERTNKIEYFNQQCSQERMRNTNWIPLLDNTSFIYGHFHGWRVAFNDHRTLSNTASQFNIFSDICVQEKVITKQIF